MGNGLGPALRGAGGSWSRRSFMRGSLATAALAPVAGTLAAACEPPPLPPNLPSGLFTLGVASGDPLPDGVVLWARLAPEPLAGGGMPAVDVPVRWQVAKDRAFARIVQEGTAVASPAWGHSVHVDVRRLRPDSRFFYRFLVGDEASPVGRTRTAPAAGTFRPLRFLFASCQNWRDGYWPAWSHAAEEGADLVVHLGDYIYESGVSGGGGIRQHNSPEVRTLDEYRNRYGLYKGDPALQAAHAACPWVVTWDDHEVENNYAGLLPEGPAEAAAFPARRAAAYQAWWEHQPVRLPPPDGWNLRVYRALDWGTLARFHVIDSRQYRSDQACSTTSDLGQDCPDRHLPDRTLLGPAQEVWLGQSLLSSDATWDVLANQVVFTSMPLAGTIFNFDQWDGYPAARTRVIQQLAAAGTENPIVITGDIHAAGVADVIDEPPGSPAVATEFVGTSISSRFDPALADAAEQLIGALPHVRYANVRQRGYVRCDVDDVEFVARFQMVESVTTPTSPLTTAATWTVTAGIIGAES
jgi:alkaline phosphatase D